MYMPQKSVFTLFKQNPESSFLLSTWSPLWKPPASMSALIMRKWETAPLEIISLPPCATADPAWTCTFRVGWTGMCLAQRPSLPLRAMSHGQWLEPYLLLMFWVHTYCCFSPQSCLLLLLRINRQPALLPWIRRRGMIRDSSVHPFPLSEINLFDLSENPWIQGP